MLRKPVTVPIILPLKAQQRISNFSLFSLTLKCSESLALASYSLLCLGTLAQLHAKAARKAPSKIKSPPSLPYFFFKSNFYSNELTQITRYSKLAQHKISH